MHERLTNSLKAHALADVPMSCSVSTAPPNPCNYMCTPGTHDKMRSQAAAVSGLPQPQGPKDDLLAARAKTLVPPAMQLDVHFAARQAMEAAKLYDKGTHILDWIETPPEARYTNGSLALWRANEPTPLADFTVDCSHQLVSGRNNIVLGRFRNRHVAVKVCAASARPWLAGCHICLSAPTISGYQSSALCVHLPCEVALMHSARIIPDRSQIVASAIGLLLGLAMLLATRNATCVAGLSCVTQGHRRATQRAH